MERNVVKDRVDPCVPKPLDERVEHSRLRQDNVVHMSEFYYSPFSERQILLEGFD